MANPVILSLMDWIRGVGGSKSTYLSLMTLFCVNLLLFFVRASSGAANLKKNDDFPKSTRSLPPLLKHFFAPTKRDLMPTTSDQKGVIRRLLRKLHFALRTVLKSVFRCSGREDVVRAPWKAVLASFVHDDFVSMCLTTAAIGFSGWCIAIDHSVVSLWVFWYGYSVGAFGSAWLQTALDPSCQVAGAAGAATALMTYATIVNPHETAVVSFPRSSAFIAYLAASVFAAFTGPQKKSAIWAHVGGICGALFGAAFAGALFYLIFKGATELIVLFTLCPVALLMFAVSGALSDSSLGQPVRASLPADSPSALLPGIGAVPVRMMRELKRMRFALDEAESTLADVRGELARLAKDGSKEGIEKLRAFASSQGSIEKLCAPGPYLPPPAGILTRDSRSNSGDATA